MFVKTPIVDIESQLIGAERKLIMITKVIIGGSLSHLSHLGLFAPKCWEAWRKGGGATNDISFG